MPHHPKPISIPSPQFDYWLNNCQSGTVPKLRKPPLLISHSSLYVTLFPQTILGEFRDEDDEILPRKDYEVKNMSKAILKRKVFSPLSLVQKGQWIHYQGDGFKVFVFAFTELGL